MTYEEERIKFENIKVKTKEKKLEERMQRKNVHKEFIKKHKTLFRILDITIILLVLVNFGTAIITNALVVKSIPDVQIMEANPVQSEVNDYEQHPQGNIVMNILMFQALMWAIILTGYLHTRLTIYTNTELWWTISIMMFYAYLVNYDFFHDLGYLIGKIIWG